MSWFYPPRHQFPFSIQVSASGSPSGGLVGGNVYAGDGAPTNLIGWKGDLYLNRQGGSGTTLYLKESGEGTISGWVAVGGAAGLGDVVGPSSAVSGRIAVFSSTTGKLLADGGAIIPATGLGDVIGPSSAVSGHIAVFSSTTGKLLADGGVIQVTTLWPALVTLTDGATPALDASLGATFRLSASGDRTIGIPTNPTANQRIMIQHYANGGARTLALNTGAGGFRFCTDIAALTQTASGKTDYIGAIYNSTDSKWDVVAVTKGF